MNLGICGSMGKTKTKTILRHILFDCDIKIYDECDYFIKYDYLIFLNHSYSYNFDFVEVLNNLNGTLIYNSDILYFNLLDFKSKVSFGLNNADILAINIKSHNIYQTFDLVIKNKIYKNFQIPLNGLFNIYNVISVIPICLIYKDIEVIKKRLFIMPIDFSNFYTRFINNLLVITDTPHTIYQALHSINNARNICKNNLICVIEITNLDIINLALKKCDFLIVNKKINLNAYNYIYKKKALNEAFRLAGMNDVILQIKKDVK